MSTKSLSHKVNMIAGIDTDGRLYLSLTQQNTDSDVMLMFLSRLANLLSQEDKDWRDDTYWLLDNAAYHRSKEVRQCLIKLGVKTILSGQYAYAEAPCEQSLHTTSERTRTQLESRRREHKCPFP